MSTTYRFNRFELRRDTLVWAALLVNTQLLLVVAYDVLSPNEITGLTAVLVPLVWITVGILAIVRTDPPAASQRQRTIALAIATAYFGLLGYFGGIWSQAITDLPVGVTVAMFSGPPGWTPRVTINTSVFFVHLLPWKVVGYAALAYMIYATILDAAGSAISGVFGLLSCVSCTWPVIATIATSVLGGGAAVAGVIYDQSYLLSTVVFVVTVGLLYWRPGWR